MDEPRGVASAIAAYFVLDRACPLHHRILPMKSMTTAPTATSSNLRERTKSIISRNLAHETVARVQIVQRGGRRAMLSATTTCRGASVEHVEVAGHRVGFEQRGHGQSLVLLHGIPGDARIWRRQLDDLADEFRVVAWDAPGCGQSSDPDGPFGVTEVAECLADFVGVLELGRPHVLGLSWGSGVALELYRIAPTVARSLVLASGYAGWAGSLPSDAVAQRLDAYLTAARTPQQEALRSWAPGLFSPTAPADVVEEALAIASDFHPAALMALARSFAETDLRRVLPSIQVPTLVLHGDADTRSPLNVGHALHDAIPRSQLVVLPGVGHVSNVEAPTSFNAEVRRFLRSVSP